MDTTYPTRPNWHELSNRRDELRTTEFFTRLPRTGRGDEWNSFFLVLQRGIDAAAAERRFGLSKFAQIKLATLLFNEFFKKVLAPNRSLMHLIHQPSKRRKALLRFYN